MVAGFVYIFKGRERIKERLFSYFFYFYFSSSSSSSLHSNMMDWIGKRYLPAERVIGM